MSFTKDIRSSFMWFIHFSGEPWDISVLKYLAKGENEFLRVITLFGFEGMRDLSLKTDSELVAVNNDQVLTWARTRGRDYLARQDDFNALADLINRESIIFKERSQSTQQDRHLALNKLAIDRIQSYDQSIATLPVGKDANLSIIKDLLCSDKES